MTNKRCFSIKTYFEFEKLIKVKKNKKKILVIFIKNYLVIGLGIDWIKVIIKLIKKNYSEYNIKFYIDAGNNHGLSILILKENIDYIRLKSNKIVLTKINQIAKKNKVLMNPDFDVIEVTKIKDFTKINI